MEKGLIMRSTGSWYEVRSQSGIIYQGRLKGKFKMLGLQTSNPLAVGDWVYFSIEDETHGHVIIEEIVPRENYIIRKSVHKTGQGQLMACNVDQAILVVTLKKPKTSLGFIDRFLVTAEAFRIPVTIVFNKMDLLNESEEEEVFQLSALYEELGYEVILTSVEKGVGLDSFKEIFKEKVSLMAGHSGVGKSSLLNEIAPGLNIKTSEISDFDHKGVHTTTYATMWELGKDTFLIDSPGINELGVMDIGEEELSHYFPEMRAFLGECKFNNCKHIQEPGCKVLAALENGEIAPSRYLSYLSILENKDNRR